MSYTVQEVVDEIRFETSTAQDLSKKSINDLYTEKDIIRYLKRTLDQYAIKTKAIEGIYSTPVSLNQRQIGEPPSILRTQAYRFGWTWVVGRKYPFVIKDLKNTHSVFPYDTFIGIPSWFVAWQKVLDIYPLSSNSFTTSNLLSDISASDTTIPVINTDGFNSPTRGRITIEDEKIEYQRAEGNSFINCTRGIEETTETSHINGTQVKENNVIIYYYKKHFEIKLYTDNIISPDFKDKEMEISDEHMPPIISRTSGYLLKKIDIQRSRTYEKEWVKWLPEAVSDIREGRSAITKGGNIRDMFTWEGDVPYDYIRD